MSFIKKSVFWGNKRYLQLVKKFKIDLTGEILRSFKKMKFSKKFRHSQLDDWINNQDQDELFYSTTQQTLNNKDDTQSSKSRKHNNEFREKKKDRIQNKQRTFSTTKPKSKRTKLNAQGNFSRRKKKDGRWFSTQKSFGKNSNPKPRFRLRHVRGFRFFNTLRQALQPYYFYKSNFHRGELGSGKTDFGKALITKQYYRWLYKFPNEQSMKAVVRKASFMAGVGVENLVLILESRLDMLLFRSRLFKSLGQIRQLIRHRFICVNGNFITSPSYHVLANSEITFHPHLFSYYFSNFDEFLPLGFPLAFPPYLMFSPTLVSLFLLNQPQFDQLSFPCRISPLRLWDYYRTISRIREKK